MAYRLFRRQQSEAAGGNLDRQPPANSTSPSILKLCCILALGILLSAADLHAQGSTVIGTITHKDGAPAVNVLVTIGGQYRYTDVSGRYKVDGVPQGTQYMTIKSGQTILWQGNVSISGAVATVDQVIP
jgi:hypothetical protein